MPVTRFFLCLIWGKYPLVYPCGLTPTVYFEKALPVRLKKYDLFWKPYGLRRLKNMQFQLAG